MAARYWSRKSRIDVARSLPLWLPGSFAKHLARGVVVCFAFAMVVTPGDLFSPLIVGIPLSVAFIGGALYAPIIRSSGEERRV